jgi:cell fate (sporulation/competence/biofilm development) regulator YlbF (YheA/YmcA/DUF963 family)
MADTWTALKATEQALDKARKASPLFALIKKDVEHNEYWAREGHMVDVMGAQADLKRLYAPIDATEEVKPFVEKYNKAYIAHYNK